MFRRITVGLKGGMLPVASVAGRLLKLGGCAPDAVWLVLPLGGPGCKLAKVVLLYVTLLNLNLTRHSCWERRPTVQCA